ncbi:hypothetical protein SAMN05216576_107259 [Ectopseudomonas chengduensis]|jgi:GNAT superfamily N-acetyltransferase|uniref:Uncharacterized protein n=1 Tax=Ectopseudomonas chengduensis TaxID=489632 RepID=A0A1G6Q516_9GAMM|nr:GNAT family N-acetyltransferase [Pseudomonas chengduensis]MBP3062085.1 hypothetical protein [Pseudomonas chengduensis]NNB75377.1 GNAT family N-acetyltransferase [Pseudomonas chengduensis]SDC87429.1 hypothetical protein SAMN05216576_107259 [Pseudomonas chengduensis]
MGLPSFDISWGSSGATKPRILILEVRDRLGQSDDPVAYLAVERKETVVRNESSEIVRASLVLEYRVIDPYGHSEAVGGSFAGSYCATANAVSLTSANVTRGAVFLDPESIQGQRVGTYLMNEIVTWVRQWPEAIVRSISLSEAQASLDNKVRRNWFYEQFGLEFAYADADHRAGSSIEIPAGALTPCSEWERNIKEIPVHIFLGDLISARRDVAMSHSTLKRAFHELLGEVRKAEASPWLWASRVWCSRNIGLLTSVGLAAAVVAAYLVRI